MTYIKKRKSGINRTNELLKSGQKLFHTQDLALLWRVINRGTLHTIIKRMVKAKVLIPVAKGLYSTVPVSQINKFQLGSALIHKYCYVSCETVLFIEGVINQKVYPITFVSSISKKIQFGDILFIYRQLKPEVLLSLDGIGKEDGYFIASKERAIADMRYFNSKYYFDNLKI